MKLLTLLLALAILPLAAPGQSTIAEGDQFAWDANSGWLDLRPERPNVGDGVRVGDAFLSGYAWSANTGWINFGNGSPANGYSYANSSGATFGVNQDGAGNLSGLAWSANTGWINFGWAESTNADRPRFDVASGNFTGYAWSANTGWINLGTGILRVESIAITDSDMDGISDTWEMFWAESLTGLTAIGDYDHDGVSDVDEYILDTIPIIPTQPLRITRINKIPNLTAVEMEWPSSPARIYGVEYRTNLLAGIWNFAGNVPGAQNTNATTAAIAGTLPQVFVRIAAKLPLSP